MTISKFQFGTKADNLIKLSNISIGIIPDIFVLTVQEWFSNPKVLINKIKNKFLGKVIIVRSSAPSEDSLTDSMAGVFNSILDVNSNSELELDRAISSVISSYSINKQGNEDINKYQILIQPMLKDVKCSGVIFTRDLERLGPYYVINYDNKSGKTDTITAGFESDHNKLIILKDNLELKILNKDINQLIIAVQEIEKITDNDQLDIEFAIDKNNNVYILQVRPLVTTKILLNKVKDQKIKEEIKSIELFLSEKLGRKENLFGDSTIYGQMPDWNPAEIIGTFPKPISISLYNYLIMNYVWREGRNYLGYKNPTPHSLMAVIGGRPYVDVRNSFNSLLPKSIDKDLGEKLVNYYISLLKKYPEYHDKVEFKIVISCLTFTFDEDSEKLFKAGFSNLEILKFKSYLHELTEQIIKDQNGILKKLENDVVILSERRNLWLKEYGSISQIPYVVSNILEDSIRYGTIPFSAYARCAFIATSLLKSLVDVEVLSTDEYDQFLLGIDTIAGQFIMDLKKLKNKEIPLTYFLNKYGHLRPGTYDNTSPRYDENPELYLGDFNERDFINLEATISNLKKPFCLSKEKELKIKKIINKYQFNFSVDQLFSFIRKCIIQREYIKFEFTKNLSYILKLLNEFGEYHGFSKDDVSFIIIEDIINLANSPSSKDSIQFIKECIEHRRKRYELHSYLNLPDLIVDKNDIREIKLTKHQPNFITNKKIIADGLSLDKSLNIDLKDLEGKIILIENADPGFDWLFSKNISGLITKYGGVASHMSIRCAEFGLPAAIGCGEQIYQELKSANKIILNCTEKKVEAYRGRI